MCVLFSNGWICLLIYFRWSNLFPDILIVSCVADFHLSVHLQLFAFWMELLKSIVNSECNLRRHTASTGWSKICIRNFYFFFILMYELLRLLITVYRCHLHGKRIYIQSIVRNDDGPKNISLMCKCDKRTYFVYTHKYIIDSESIWIVRITFRYVL